jgi:hypothetical protein
MVDLPEAAGLALAALALSTARLARDVKCGAISVAEARAIIADAHALLRDAPSWVNDRAALQAAGDFLGAAEGLAELASPSGTTQ